MSVQGSYRLPCVLAACAALISGCGGGSTATSSMGEKPAATAPCRVGKSILPHVSEPPALWAEAAGSPVALACSAGEPRGGAAIVGFALPYGGTCVSAYSRRLGELAKQACQVEARWTVHCEGNPGCVRAFVHARNLTELDGPMEPRVEGVRVTVNGAPLRHGVMVAHVDGRLERSIRAEEPFGYFAVLIPRCVPQNAVVVTFLGSDGSPLSSERGWDASVPPCGNGGNKGPRSS